VKIAVFGLGYVGAVSAAAFASRGHEVTGVDTAQLKVDALNRAEPPVGEPGLAELVREMVEAGRLRAMNDGAAAAAECELSLVCVGTPSQPNGSLSASALERVMATIGEALPGRSSRHTVVVRSTMVPGTSEDVLIPILERASGLRAGSDFGFAVNPEFLREGTSLKDFADPVKTVIGQLTPESGDVVAALYEGFPGSVFRLPVRGAEMAKYVDNTFHALKITFANEIGNICRAFGLDSHGVMESFLADTKLNISTAYLKPGFAFGGSCLPKDLRALLYAARRRDLELPLLESILVSNEKSIARIVDTVIGLGCRRVGMFGLSFKPGTDDLRESPFVELGERLLGKGFDLRIYDPHISPAHLVGANREYVAEHIPHLSALLSDSVDEVLEHAEVCIVGAAREETVRALARANGRRVVDLVRLPDADTRRGGEGYVGVAW
jgi:GDP-mannose 6-dehydrogenase